MSAVDRRRSGMRSTARSPTGASNRTASTRSPRCADTTNPPSSAADALSGCPSSAVASRSWSPVESRRPPSTCPANTPPTDAAADDPMPRDNGMRLRIAIRQPIAAGRGPIDASSACSRPATKRLSRTAGSSPAPSPSTASSRPPSASTASTVTVLHTSSARPRQS